MSGFAGLLLLVQVPCRGPYVVLADLGREKGSAVVVLLCKASDAALPPRKPRPHLRSQDPGTATVVGGVFYVFHQAG